MHTTYDVLIVGGGPGGSTCARALTLAGARVAVVDRAEFPRVKLCAGWLSPAIWDVLRMSPREYPHGLWEWRTCHVHYRGKAHSIPCRGWFIRRCELDDFLLRTSAADLHLGATVRHIGRADDGAWSIVLPDRELRARYLVGAAGTHCPVARMLVPARPRRPVGVQELELRADARAIERTRLGDDGEPELLLFDDGGGYGWNVPKSEWLNVGCGTMDATAVRDAWRHTRTYLSATGHVPAETERELEHVKGHSYYLFDPHHLEFAERDNALLVGDALGLAHPITAEGILPAVVSGRLAAHAILAGDPRSYPGWLRRDRLLSDYRRVHRVVEATRALRDRLPSRRRAGDSALANRAVARGFAWLFSGARLPVPRLLDLVLNRIAEHRP